jgi:hypothetical protein
MNRICTRKHVVLLFTFALLLLAAITLIRRPFASAAIYDAARLLRKIDPSFNSSEFRTDKIDESADGSFLVVRFTRTTGIGRGQYTVNVPKRHDWISEVRALWSGDH